MQDNRRRTAETWERRVTLLPLQGNAFSFDIAQHRDGTAPWNGTVSGTVSPTEIVLTIRATGTIEGWRATAASSVRARPLALISR